MPRSSAAFVRLLSVASSAFSMRTDSISERFSVRGTLAPFSWGPSPGDPGPWAVPGARPGDEIPRPILLTKKGAEVLVRIERALEEATRTLAPPATADRTVEAPTAGERSDGVVAATDGRGRAVRGN